MVKLRDILIAFPACGVILGTIGVGSIGMYYAHKNEVQAVSPHRISN